MKVVSSHLFEDHIKKLNPEKNDEPVNICKGIPQDSVLSKEVIFAQHKRSLDGGVAITMSHVKSLF